MVRGFLGGLLTVLVVAAGVALLLERGRADREPAVAEAAPAEVKVPGRPPSREELSAFFCGTTRARPSVHPRCRAALMELYRACGLDASHPKTPRCVRLLRRVVTR